MTFVLRDFDTTFDPTPPSQQELDDARLKLQFYEFVNNILPNLSDDQLHTLVSGIPTHALPAKVDMADPSKVSMLEEVSNLLSVVTAVRNEVMLNGRLKNGVEVKEAMVAVRACVDMIKTLHSFQAEILNIDRIQKIETATVKILKERFSEEAAVEFIDYLEEIMCQES